ncbi:MAG: hypothetical protein WCD35_19295 [Mycobacteriales bacterium]
MRRSESRWPAALAVVAAVGAQVLVADRVLPGPRLLLPGVELVLLVALVAADPSRLTAESKDLRLLSLAMLAVVAAVNVVALVSLVDQLVGGAGNGRSLLGAAAGVWLTNVVVFGLAYWELDRGGPLARAGARPGPAHPDLWFPQDGDARQAAPPGWEPAFVDYLFVALMASTAFSPTDTMPLTPRAKGLVGLQSVISLLTVGLVAARAVNILR